MLKKYLAGTLAVLLIAAGAVFGLAAPASAHTGDMSHSAVCNTATGQYDVTTTLTTYNTPGDLTGTVKAHIGDSNFAGGWGEGSFNWEFGPDNIVPNGSKSWSYSIPGNSTSGPWVYSWTLWSSGFTVASDGRIEGLAGNCVQPLEAKADWGYTPSTCTMAETLVVDNANLVNATWSADSLLLNGAVGPGMFVLDAVLDPGAVWADGQTGHFEVTLNGPLTEVDCVASASVKPTPPTCFAPGGVAPDTFVNAVFGVPVYGNGQYTIVATATGVAHFLNPGQDGVSPDGTTKTFTGSIAAQLTEGCVASAAITTNPGTCTETGTVEGGPSPTPPGAR